MLAIRGENIRMIIVNCYSLQSLLILLLLQLFIIIIILTVTITNVQIQKTEKNAQVI
jgi:hypothetical protein